MTINMEEFGYLKDGRKVEKYLIENASIGVEVLSYGGIITKIYIQGEEDENLVLGFETLEEYIEKSPHFGCITGRVAGRISNASFTIDGVNYSLEKNNGNNCLHGGFDGLDKKLWTVDKIEDGVELSYFSPHLENGFPGNLEIKVRYRLDGAKLIIEYLAESDRKTYINLTNHTYFNLTGGREDVLGHSLYIDADKFLKLDEDSIPVEISNVDGRIFDRRNGGKLKDLSLTTDEDIKIVGSGFDHPFILNKKIEKEIVLKEEKSNKSLVVTTTEPSVVVYTGNFLGSEGILSTGSLSHKYMGICLETQDFPDAINRDWIETKFIDKDKSYRSCTVYEFVKGERKSEIFTR